jgi:small neutral amino acid transporter SnatA (MarC family)
MEFPQTKKQALFTCLFRFFVYCAFVAPLAELFIFELPLNFLHVLGGVIVFLLALGTFQS